MSSLTIVVNTPVAQVLDVIWTPKNGAMDQTVVPTTSHWRVESDGVDQTINAIQWDSGTALRFVMSGDQAFSDFQVFYDTVDVNCRNTGLAVAVPPQDVSVNV